MSAVLNGCYILTWHEWNIVHQYSVIFTSTPLQLIHQLIMDDWPLIELLNPLVIAHRADSRFAPSQWETALLCNNVSHWLSANLESALAKSRYFQKHYFQRINAYFVIPPETKFRGGILDSPCSSVRLSVRPSVCPSVGRCPDDNSNSFQWI